MRRRLTHNPYFTALLLISTLTLSFIAVLPAKSPSATTDPDTAKIVSMLELLRGNVTDLDNEAFGNTSSAKGRRTALENKISAIIHQIEAEALSGSLNKLRNDVNKTVTEWILPYSPQDAEMLFEMIRKIIELIEGIVLLSPEASFVFAPETPLAGDTVTFNASASEDPDGTIVSYTWNFGDSTVITESDPVATHIYATYGIYTVSLTVTDNDCLTDTESKPVKVIAPPTASFTYSPLVPLVDEVIIFNASGSAPNGGEIESYVWDLGDGFTKNGEIVTHAYTAEGTYSVVLNVTDTEGLWDISAADVTVYAPPIDFPPEIIGVFRVPEEPNYDEYVRILASVIDIEGEVESVILGYSTNSIDWTNETMAFNENIGFYTAEIPPQPYNTTVNYKVYASDNIGKWSVSRTYNYTVVDRYLPIVEIEEPTEGSYLHGLVNITVTVQEDNLVEAILAINGTIVSSWQESGKHVFTWNTSSLDYPDGTYIIEFSASDEADNSAEKRLTATVDNTLPTGIIIAPSEGAFLRRVVIIVITGEDVNLERMELEIGDVLVKTWTSGGSQVYLWDTEVDGIDGTHTITLTVYDKAGNSDESSVTVVVDNTRPTVRIDEPAEGSYLAGIIDIEVFILENNLVKAELTINDTEVVSWTSSGEHVFGWDTTAYAEGVYVIKLNALDEAGNIGEKTIEVTVDNTSPIIEIVTWTPKEPSVDEQVNVTVKAIDPQPGSGLQNVTLWYRNTTMDDSQPIPMSLNVTSGNWTATIPAQSVETTVEFFIEAFDNAGNKAASDETYEYEVIASVGIPLAWIIAIIFLILAATVAAIYYWRRRRRENQGLSVRA